MMSRRAFFITVAQASADGTVVTAALLRAASLQGLRTAAVKPLATGCDQQGCNPEALLLQKTMTEPLAYQQVNPVLLADAMPPQLAAARAGRLLRANQLAGYCQAVTMGPADLVLVQGAGGWREPISPRETCADLAKALGLPVILVVKPGPGCANHALLTAQAIAADGLPLAAWVVIQPRAPDDFVDEQVAALQNQLPAPLLGSIPWLDPLDLDPLDLDKAATALNLQLLL
jgi:dethiobiotin synthetase